MGKYNLGKSTASVNVEINNDTIKANALVHKDDLGRVIGKKGRVAGAIRTLAHAAAIRNKETVEIEFNSLED